MLDRATVERLEAQEGPLLIALSGGGDSTALLHLMTERFGASRVRAAIVDHALREGSREDAARACSFAAALGVGARVLTLTWIADERRNQERARRKRYAALCDHARTLGAGVIVTGHTRDDQAETVFMRAAAGSSWRGLAGMAALAPAPVWPEGRGLVLARPLLGAARLDLRSVLRTRGAAWIEDPANSNSAFERVRVRRRLSALEGAGFESARLAALAGRLRRLADVLAAQAAALIQSAAVLGEDIVVWREAWSGASEARVRALVALMAGAAGAEREAPFSAVAGIEARFLSDAYRGETFGGVRFEPVREGVRLGRDPGAALGRSDGIEAPPSLALPVGRPVCWDGRFVLEAKEAGWSVGPGGVAPRFMSFAKAGAPQAPGRAVAVQLLCEARVKHALGLV